MTLTRDELQALADAPFFSGGMPGRRSGGRGVVARGYAAVPGSGPDSETCKSCRHAYTMMGGNKAFWKCGLRQATRGPATDIRVKSPACSRWMPKVPA